MSRKWNSRIEQNLNLPLESYSAWLPCIINRGLKSRNELRDHSIYILYFRSSLDLHRTSFRDLSPWLIVQGDHVGCDSWAGLGFVQFSNFIYVTYCHPAVLDIYGLFTMVFDCLWVVVAVLEVVQCKWL